MSDLPQFNNHQAQRDATKVLMDIVNAAHRRVIAEYEAQFPEHHMVIEWEFKIKGRKKGRKVAVQQTMPSQP